MRLGIGIDTGGTYTDAVLYDFETKTILSSAKSLTTKEDLAIGIRGALDGLPQDKIQKAEIVSLSTTLATNASVEEKGGRGKLVFIGADKDIVLKTGKNYGLPDLNEMFFLDGKVDTRGEIIKEPNWETFMKDVEKWISDADAVAVVQQLGVRNSTTEQRAKELIMENYELNTICGHELFSDLNYIKRGSSTLLNARLIPVIKDFLDAIKTSLKERNVNAPVVIVRSDGSLMSENFTTIRPVETLLCGPAASVMGGIELTGEENCVIVDMGGTTTDLAIVKDSVPVKAHDGVKVGKWQTFVKSVYIDTFGLGGDSRVVIDNSGDISLGNARVVPVCIAAKRYPEIREKLKSLAKSRRITHEPQHELFYLVKDITDSDKYNADERALCTALKENGPMIYAEAALTVKKKLFFNRIDRLEKEGIIMRCGLTPTDMMHVKGDFNLFDREASNYAAEYVSARLGIPIDSIADKVYDLVKEKMYFNIVRMLLEDKYSDYKNNGLDYNTERLIRDSWDAFKNPESDNLIKLNFKMPSSLVGVGAPIHLFLPEVADALNTKCVIPENAGVANALGAIVGNVSATVEISVKPDSEGDGFIVFGKHSNTYTNSYEKALEEAKKEAKDAAIHEAKLRGATGDISVTLKRDYNESLAKELPEGMFLSTTISATALGRIIL
ncbi:hydantoinase/oxoprolinase family protein [Alkalibacter mobilis]|uniref:hydantoinase/oxoprolinase family protein n=1 Tax=Alkalibacter mobilis TaxID=2787712 RepID=UPI0018A02631|nr:hydantoinase/oxoprolinase family protein [Alkalibacter mobilis]MBF7097451.1 hydantoinase/oxoprolinase family protein [Alkalibacter mobilis]